MITQLAAWKRIYIIITRWSTNFGDLKEKVRNFGSKACWERRRGGGGVWSYELALERRRGGGGVWSCMWLLGEEEGSKKRLLVHLDNGSYYLYIISVVSEPEGAAEARSAVVASFCKCKYLESDPQWRAKAVELSSSLRLSTQLSSSCRPHKNFESSRRSISSWRKRPMKNQREEIVRCA